MFACMVSNYGVVFKELRWVRRGGLKPGSSFVTIHIKEVVDVKQNIEPGILV